MLQRKSYFCNTLENNPASDKMFGIMVSVEIYENFMSKSVFSVLSCGKAPYLQPIYGTENSDIIITSVTF